METAKAAVMPSGLTYLYGDVMQDLFASKAVFAVNEKLPCRGAQVGRGDLATMILVSALAHLSRAGLVTLTLGTKGRILKSKAVFVKRTSQAAIGLEGIEQGLLVNITGKADADTGSGLVSRLLSKDCQDPSGKVLEVAKQNLLERGFMTQDERHGIAKVLGKELVPQCDRILSLQPEHAAWKQWLAQFRSAQPDLYVTLWKEAAAGVVARQQIPDVDFD